MRLFKWMMYCVLLTAVTLVGCSKDEVDPVEAAAGEYTSTKYEVSNCEDEEENETVDVTNCTSDDGCLKLTLNMDMTVTMDLLWLGNVASSETGTFTLDGKNITVNIPDSDLMTGTMDGDKITFITRDETGGCQELIEYSK